MITYLDYINNINESISVSKIKEYIDIVNKILIKKCNTTEKSVYPAPGFEEGFDGKTAVLMKNYYVAYKNGKLKCFTICWNKSNDKLDPYSINFFDNINILFDGRGKSNLSIRLFKNSLIYYIPIIAYVVNSGNYDLSQNKAIELGRSIYKTTKSNKSISEATSEVTSYFTQKWHERELAARKKYDSDLDAAKFQKINAEYEAIYREILKGAKTVEEIELAISKNNNISIKPSKEEKEIEDTYSPDGEKMDPEMVFKKMEGYVKMVVKGINPSVILCGAPGVGKTFRVRQVLKQAGYEEEKNLFTIKGKCSVRRLYLALYEYKDKGDLLLIDDADALVGPKAPEECINILKAALDSTSDAEGRLISYGINSPIKDDNGNEIPKRFYYNGGVIVITNYNAGSLDTALRGRSYIQDIHFSSEDVLKIIKNLLPKLSPDKLSMSSKDKAYKYLIELLAEDYPMELSIRTFTICATLFESINDDDDLAKSMIKEQMKLQSSREKSKY